MLGMLLGRERMGGGPRVVLKVAEHLGAYGCRPRAYRVAGLAHIGLQGSCLRQPRRGGRSLGVITR